MTGTSPAAVFGARSVAVVGASPKPGSAGARALEQLVAGGFEGPIFAVNPNYEAIGDRRCFPSLGELPAVPELAILAVPNPLLQDQLAAAAAAGARGAVIFASGHEDGGQTGSLHERLGRIAAEAGMAVCGPNGMGFIDFDNQLRALAYPEEPDLEPGPIAWVSHSGSAFTALLHNDRGLRFNLAVSAGGELTTTVADYVHHALDRRTTRVVALFLETVRDPNRFVDALRRADSADVPVVALKVGQRTRSSRMVAAHSGALAGEDAAFDALFDAHGVMRVRTLNEMADLLELLSAGRPAAPGGLAAIHDSGGERALLVDVAEDAGVRLADISDGTRAALGEVLEQGLAPDNPLDAWGTGNAADDVFFSCMTHLLADEDTAALAFAVDLKRDDPAESYAPVAIKAFGSTSKPVAVVSNLATGIDPATAAEIRAAGMPVLEDLASGVGAFGRLFDRRDHRALPSPARPAPTPDRQRWRARLGEPRPLTPRESFELLTSYGVPVARAETVSSPSDAIAAARALGGAVAMKAAAPGLAHKSDAGGVRLGLSGDAAVGAGYASLAVVFGRDVIVQEMVPPGVEIAVGMVKDKQFGPLVVVAAGGRLVEVLRDRRLAVPPLDRTRAMRLLDGLAVAPALRGSRGAPTDVASLCDAIVAISNLALDLGDELAALDVNPLIAGPNGCVAVDVFVEAGGSS